MCGCGLIERGASLILDTPEGALLERGLNRAFMVLCHYNLKGSFSLRLKESSVIQGVAGQLLL